MGIKETPANFRTYYKSMRDTIRPKYEKTLETYEHLLVEEKALHSEIKSILSKYKADYKMNLLHYEEFMNNEYTTGEFYKAAKELFLNKKDNYIAKTDTYKLYKVARQQKEIIELHKEIKKYEIMLELTITQYSSILEAFYTEVHKKMIIEGKGYVLENPIGWICINRCKIKHGRKKILDWAKTREKKAQLLAEGKRLWDKSEAEYAERIGVPYVAYDYRVYLEEEYCYEFSLINCRVTKGERCRFEPAKRASYSNGKTADSIVKDCNYDINKICELPVDINTKLKWCLKADNILYLNFIRNEGQQSAHTPKANRQSR